MANNVPGTEGGLSSVIGSRFTSIISWLKEKLGRAPSRTKGMLLDDDARSADERLSSMQERPHFDADPESNLQFAARDDLDDRRDLRRRDARPFLLEEPEPDATA